MIIDNPFEYVKDNLTISEAFYRLTGRRVRPGKNTNCPFHEDTHPSFSINPDDRLFHCFSCGAQGNVHNLIASHEDIDITTDSKSACDKGMQMLGINYDWPNGNGNGTKPRKNKLENRPKLAAVKTADKKDRTMKAAMLIESDTAVEGYQRKCEAFYDYTDYEGNPAFRVFRLPGKEFRQTTWNGKCYVNFKVIDVPQYLYNVQAVSKSPYCVITEGEKDADALIKLGIPATTWPGGAGNLKPLLETWDLFEPLRGKEMVWFAPDPDDAGEKAFEAAVPYINGHVDDFRKVKWPGEGIKDAYDFIDQFFDDKTARQAVLDVLHESPKYLPENIPNVLCRADIVKKLDIPPPEWIVDDMIPIGYTMVAGRSKARKTMFLHNLAIAVAKGSMAIGKFPTRKGAVIYCSLEDDIGSWKAKLAKMLGDEPWPSNFLGTFDVERFPALETKIRQWKKAYPDLKLVILDNLTLIKKLKGGNGGNGGKDYDNEYVEQSHFKKFAKKLGIALVVVHHAGKNETGDISRDVLGTTAFVGAPDKIILVQRPVNEEKYNNILTFMNRNSADQERMALKFYPDSLTFNYAGKLEDFEITELQEQVLDVLAAKGKPMMPSQIAKELGRPPSGANNKLLARMAERGLVTKVGNRGLYQFKQSSQNE